MSRYKQQYKIAEGQLDKIKKQMLNLGNRFSIIVYLDSNSYADKYGRYECLAAFGAKHIIDVDSDHLSAIGAYYSAQNDWLFGHIGYDYKNNLEPKLSSAHPITDGFPDIFFFQPEVVVYIPERSDRLVIESLTDDAAFWYEALSAIDAEAHHSLPAVDFIQRTPKEKYLRNVEALREHIKAGDCYEINYCTEGYAENVHLDTHACFNKLNGISKAPFAAYYKLNDIYMMCASPERYLHKQGKVITSQPIKGTARRDTDADNDARVKKELSESIKDKAENVMITDLVRNDLARSCAVGSVQVDELFGIYSFPQVHQMISTVQGRLRNDMPFTNAIRYSFPMGSMTGAPKVKVMELIEQYEDVGRGLFSGTIGYISPDGDFDFNVIIRSLFYNAQSKYLSYKTGGAITYDSSAEGEWEEMRLKAWALEKIFAKD